MNKGFSLSRSTSFLKPELRTSPVSSLAMANVKLRVTSFLVLLVFLLSTVAVVIGQGTTQADAAALIAEAKSLLKKNDYEKALIAIQKAISTDPRNPAAYVQLALIHASMGDESKARLAVEEALKIDPNHAPAHQQRGAQLRRAKDFEGAIREAKLALSLKPDPEFAAYAHITLGRTYEELKRYDEALSEYREAISSNPADGSLHGTLASALFELKRYDEAEIAYRRAVEFDPLDSNAVVNLAAALQNQAKRDESIKYYKEYLRLDPKGSGRATIEQRLSQLERTPEPLLRNQMLLVMAQQGDAANAAALIKSGADPNYKSSYDSQTPLSAAARQGSLDVVKLLLSRGAKDDEGAALTNAYQAGNADIEKLLLQAVPPTPKARVRLLSAAVDKGDAGRAQSLIASGVDAAGLDAALITAIDKNRIELVRLLLDKGARVNQPDLSRTPLMLAVERDHVETVKLLLAKGAEVNAIGREDTTALKIAVQVNNAAVVRLLLAAGADTTGKDLLYLAAGAPGFLTDEDANPHPERTSEILQLLLDKGANAKSPDGDRALLAANSLEKVKLLLARGANPNTKDAYGATPLMAAADTGDKQIVEALLSAGADVNAQDSYKGDTALLLLLDAKDSRRKRNVEEYPILVGTLLSVKNISVNTQNKKGETALMRAVRLGNVESVTLLLRAGANPNAADKVGDTAYVLAYENGNAEIEKLLTTAAVQNKTPAVLNSFLVAAISKKDVAKVKELLDQGGDPNHQYAIGLDHPDITSTVLMEAVIAGDATIVQMLVDKGAEVNAKGLISGSEHGLVYGTPLEAAKDPQIMEILKKAANKKN